MIKRSNVVGALPAGDESFLRVFNDVVKCWGDGGGDKLRDDAVVCVIDCYWAGAVDFRGVGFGDDVEVALIKLRWRGETFS